MSQNLKTLLAKTKPIIAMAHFPALPGSPHYDASNGMNKIIDSIHHDIIALQRGGVDAIMFGNEADLPYLLHVGPETVAAMAAVIGQVKSELKIPFGVDVLWDPIAALALAKGTGACFIREIMTSAYVSDMGMWNTNCGEMARYRRTIDAADVDLLFVLAAEFSSSLETRSLANIARSVVFSSAAQILCVSGPITGTSAKMDDLEAVKKAVPQVSVLSNTGVSIENVAKILAIADGAVVGTTLKKDGITWNPVDQDRVARFMEVVNKCH